MITALDSSVIIDVLVGDPIFGQKSLEALKHYYDLGKLILCDTVGAEIVPALPDRNLKKFMDAWHLELLPGNWQQAELAGCQFADYRKRNKSAKKILPDFLIAAHAQMNADQLLTRDRGYTRDYFDQLKIVAP